MGIAATGEDVQRRLSGAPAADLSQTRPIGRARPADPTRSGPGNRGYWRRRATATVGRTCGGSVADAAYRSCVAGRHDAARSWESRLLAQTCNGDCRAHLRRICRRRGLSVVRGRQTRRGLSVVRGWRHGAPSHLPGGGLSLSVVSAWLSGAAVCWLHACMLSGRKESEHGSHYRHLPRLLAPVFPRWPSLSRRSWLCSQVRRVFRVCWHVLRACVVHARWFVFRFGTAGASGAGLEWVYGMVTIRHSSLGGQQLQQMPRAGLTDRPPRRADALRLCYPGDFPGLLSAVQDAREQREAHEPGSLRAAAGSPRAGQLGPED